MTSNIRIGTGNRSFGFVLGLALAVLVFPAAAPTAVNAQQAPLVIDTRNGTLAQGTAFVVSPEGYLATSFSLIERMRKQSTKLRLVTENGKSYSIEGFVAASRRHDIVLLAVKHPPQNPTVPDFSPDAAPKPGDPFTVLTGQVAVEPQLRRLMTGAELLAGLDRTDARAPWQAAETSWMVFNMSFSPSSIGAPVRDVGGEIVGMLTGPTGPDLRPRFAVHIRHVQDLLLTVQGDEKKAEWPKLNELAKHEDPVDETIMPSPDDPEGQPPARDFAGRLAQCQQRETVWKQSAAQVDAAITKLRSDGDGLTAEINARNALIAHERANPQDVEEVEEKGDDKEEKKKKVLSAEQKRKIAEWQGEIADLQSQWSAVAAEVQPLVEFELPHDRRALSRAQDELFYMADPFELGDEQDQRDLNSVLDAEIAKGGAPGLYYIARGLCKLAIRDLDQAAADFQRFDAGLANLAEVAEGRRLVLLGQKEEGEKKIRNATKPQKATKPPRRGKPGQPAKPHTAVQFIPGARLLCLRARVEMDCDEPSKAVAHLELALKEDGDPATIHRALAWIHASPPAGKPASGRKALEHAILACKFTGHRDWSCLAALAAAHAVLKDFDEAEAWLRRARKEGPERIAAKCDAWEAELAAKKPLTRNWKW